jgi:hypothetical protein
VIQAIRLLATLEGSRLVRALSLRFFRGGQPPGQRLVLAVLPPAADHVIALRQPVHEHGDIRGVVLQVCIQGHDHLAPGMAEARGHGRGLAEVPAKPDDPHERVPLAQALEDLEGPVRAAVVYEDDLIAVPARERLDDLPMERLQVVLFIEQGHDYRDLRQGRLGHGLIHSYLHQ